MSHAVILPNGYAERFRQAIAGRSRHRASDVRDAWADCVVSAETLLAWEAWVGGGIDFPLEARGSDGSVRSCLLVATDAAIADEAVRDAARRGGGRVVRPSLGNVVTIEGAAIADETVRDTTRGGDGSVVRPSLGNVVTIEGAGVPERRPVPPGAVRVSVETTETGAALVLSEPRRMLTVCGSMAEAASTTLPFLLSARLHELADEAVPRLILEIAAAALPELVAGLRTSRDVMPELSPGVVFEVTFLGCEVADEKATELVRSAMEEAARARGDRRSGTDRRRTVAA
jgi:hypothetical protein